MSRWFLKVMGWALVAVAGLVAVSPPAHADPLQSANYRFDETSIGSGGLIQSSSANYQANSAIGDLGVGNSASANYQIDAGSKTTDDPALAFYFNDSDVDFGDFSAGGAATTTASFSISNYTSYGYTVQIIGNPPSNGSHTITAMSSTGASVAGTEQFGINLVANTSPASFGANPDQGQFGFGVASGNYNTSNQFRYVSGETIASAPKSSGVTTFTVSYIVNVSSLTPGGQYNSGQTIIVTGTY